MNIIDEILNEIETNDLDEQVKHLSDQIQEDEDQNINLEYDEEGNPIRPEGSNIFLVVPCKGQLKNQKAYLTLEREFPGEFFVGLWTERNDSRYHKIKNWSIREHKPKKIMQEYARILKMFGRR